MHHRHTIDSGLFTCHYAYVSLLAREICCRMVVASSSLTLTDTADVGIGHLTSVAAPALRSYQLQCACLLRATARIAVDMWNMACGNVSSLRL